MKMIQVPPDVELVDGSRCKLAKLPMNTRFIEFMTISKSDPDPVEVVKAMLGCLEECIKYGNPDLTPEQVTAKREMLPFDWVMELLDSANGE